MLVNKSLISFSFPLSLKIPTFEIDKLFLIMEKDKYIRFDWAVKRLLRNKANFDVLEGLLTVLLDRQIHIIDILESESNQQDYDDKFNRVDIKARDSKNEIIIVEVQVTRELYFLERILYGVAKAITEHMALGELYSEVKKVYSISILYFDIGKGNDYLYHGQNTFTGVHTGRPSTSDRERTRCLGSTFTIGNLPGVFLDPGKRV